MPTSVPVYAPQTGTNHPGRTTAKTRLIPIRLSNVGKRVMDGDMKDLMVAG